MIPRKVEVEGFLCYRDKQVVDLNGSDLWVFTGRNGSGKSTIFDAITFALFGVHRDGSEGLDNLINAGASEFRVAFEFDLGPDRFKIDRSRRRGAPSTDRQVFRHELDDRGEEHWLPVPETGGKNGLAQWVKENVGLDYELFTSSMLLEQGQAEKLLKAKPKQRFEIVAEVADLKSYQILHKKAEVRRQERKTQAEMIRASLGRKPVVEPAVIVEAEARLSEAESTRFLAAAERDRLVAIEGRARVWRELSEEREKAIGAADRARQVIEASATIEADWARLGELEGVLPALLEAADRRAGIAGRQFAIAGRGLKRADIARSLDGLSALAEESGHRLAEVVEEMVTDEARRATATNQLAALAIPIDRVRRATVQRRAVADLEAALAAHPADLADQADRLADEEARRVEWKAALPTLETLATHREGLAGARARSGAASQAVAHAEAEVRRAGAATEATRSEASKARLAATEADRRWAEARTISRSVGKRLDLFMTLRDAAACDRCGQSLTPEHHTAEADRLRRERDEALRESEEAERTYLEAHGRAEVAEAAWTEANRIDRDAGATLGHARRDLAQADTDTTGHQAACLKAFGDLDESFRSAVASEPVADWTATTFPTPADLADGRQLRDGLSEAARLAQRARVRLEAMRGEQARLEEARRTLDAIGLQPGDPEAEGEHSRLTKEVDSLGRCLETHRVEKASAEANFAGLATKIEAFRREAAAIEVEQATDRALIEASREATDRARTTIPTAWIAAFDGAMPHELEVWEAERRSLRDRGVEKLAEELPKAHWTINYSETQVADLDSRLGEIPKEARRDPAEIVVCQAEAAARLATAEGEARASQRNLDLLRRDRDDRAALESQTLEADRALAVSAKLAELLGRSSLQRALIRDAERGILDSANPILHDLSGGDLELRLAVEDVGDDQALALEVVDRTHGPGRTLGVAFLSGSQKFRVAVSLALGIGQYARGRDRPIQSVIIDEGFGCLDRQGRDEMIAQLSALKGRLARVILVSHQEEFAEAFKDGHRFEIRDGSTVIEEFHR